MGEVTAKEGGTVMEIQAVKAAASGRWLGIFETIGIEYPSPPGEHGPCPICKTGEDRFRLDKDTIDGGWFCNQCTPKAGDGVALVQRVLGLTFRETL